MIAGLQIKTWNATALGGRSDVIFLPLPMFHVYANVGVQSLTFIAGARWRWCRTRATSPICSRRSAGSSRPSSTACRRSTSRCSTIPLVQQGKIDFKSIRICFSGAAPLLADTKTRFEALTGARIVEGYSLTEAMMALCVNPAKGENKLGSVGMPLPDVTVRIFDDDDGTRELAAKEVGEIAIAAPQLMTGYWNQPERDRDGAARARSIDGVTRRFLHTGDLGYLDEDGYLFIVDRKKDLIKTSGYQVWPREIEEAIAAHPGGRRSRRRRHSRRDQGRGREGVGRAARRPDGHRSRTCARSAARGWRRTKCPATIEFRAELPKTMVGKVLRRALREGGIEAGRAGWAGSAGVAGSDATLAVALALVAPRLAPTSIATRSMRSASRRWPTFPSSSLVAGADRSRRMDIAMMIWVLKGADGRIAIVDSGFHRDRYFTQFTVKDYIKPSDALAPLGIKADDVTDLLLTHMHWDHAGGIDLFPKARVWVQKDEYDYYTGEAWQSARTHGGIDADDVLEIVKRNTDGKVSFVRGDDETSLSGISVRHRRQAHVRVAVRRRLDAAARGGDRVGQHVSLREPRHARADRADARRRVEPAHAGPDEVAGERAAAPHSRTRPGRVRPLPSRLRPHRPH